MLQREMNIIWKWRGKYIWAKRLPDHWVYFCLRLQLQQWVAPSCSFSFFYAFNVWTHVLCISVFLKGSKTLVELGWIVGSSASGWIWVGMDRWMFSIWKWSGGRHLIVSDIVGPEFLCKGPPWITICLFFSASAQLWNIQYHRIT